jgi:hypothetical protein
MALEDRSRWHDSRHGIVCVKTNGVAAKDASPGLTGPTSATPPAPRL